MSFLPITQMRERVERDQSESDVAAYFALMYFGEFIVKTIVSAMVAALSNDPERQRYSFLYRLVRADSIGNWTACLRELCTGPASHLLDTEAREERIQLTQNVSKNMWQHNAVTRIHECAIAVSPEHPELAKKVQLLHWFDDFTIVRNKTRGHGAKRVGELGALCDNMRASIISIYENLAVFQREWAYLHRNLSGKYRVTPLSDNTPSFDELKRRRDVSLQNGVYVVFDELHRVELLHSDPDASDFLVPNGAFSPKKHEFISYVTGSTVYDDSAPYLLPTGHLPKSETEGTPDLKTVGKMLTNIPVEPTGYVHRDELEADLFRQLQLEHHPIVTLSGYGGIGKTSLALKVIHDIARNEDCPYSLCVWFSARDIDLLQEGAKQVRPRGLSLPDFAKLYADLVAGASSRKKGFDAMGFLADDLSDPQPFDRILFVFDNFETVESPGELFAWIDSHVRSPNKVLITTRIRGEFHADYPLTVLGMSKNESLQLISQTARFLGIDTLLKDDWRLKLIEESSGHPYVIKILLGEVAKTHRLGRPRRVVASKEKMLDALFERTYESLSPAAKRVLLTLANWNSSLPEIGLEAVLLRNVEERLDVQTAIDELVHSSLVLRRASADGNVFLDAPLAARLFAKKRLEISPWHAAVKVDTSLLKAFGASHGDMDERGVGHRIERFFTEIAGRVSDNPKYLATVIPVLEYIATGYPQGWVLLADLYEETFGLDRAELIKECLRRFLEKPDDKNRISWIWQRLSTVCHETGDLAGEIHALVKMAQITGLPLYVISNAANRVNAGLSSMASLGKQSIGKEEQRVLLLQLVQALEERQDEMDATDFSRLGWLYVNVGDTTRALESAGQGLAIDDSNEYCQSLFQRLEGKHTNNHFQH